VIHRAIKVAPAAGDEALAGSYVNRSVAFQSKGDLDAALADKQAIKISRAFCYLQESRAFIREKERT